MVLPGLVLGGNLYTDSSETKSDNRLSQWGAGLEVLTDWVDFRANFYDASSSKKKNGEYTTAETEIRSVTTARTRSRTTAKSTTTRKVEYSEPYAWEHGVYYDRSVQTTTETTYTTRSRTTYRTETTHTTTTKLFERFERGMDGWDAELGFRLPWKGPETRLFGGWYDYENPFGEDVEGWKARLELRPGPWLSLDAELYENGRLHGGDWFLGARVSIPLSRDLGWKDFKEGLFSLRPRCLEDRMRGEMARREGVRAAESAWGENLAKRQVDTRVEVSERSVTRASSRTVTNPTVTATTPGVPLKENITFVDGAHTGTTDGKAATPYNNLQAAADAARNSGNTTVFVYEPGGRRIDGDKVYIAAGNGGKYDQTVEIHPGLTLTSTVSAGGFTYQTVGKPMIETAKTLDVTGYGIPTAVIMRENTTFERMAVTTTGGHHEGIVVSPSGNTGGDVFIRDSDINSSGRGIITDVDPGRKLGNVTISGSSIKAGLDGVYTVNKGTMGDLIISGSSIEAQEYGVVTLSHEYGSRVGDLTISGSSISGRRVGVFTETAGGTIGDLTISGSSISSQGNGVVTEVEPGAIGDLTISGSSISAQGDGVITNVDEGTIGAMTITNAAGNISAPIWRRCTGTCTGPLTVDGVKISDGSGFWNNP